jgi:hypothetical protein
MNKKEIKVTNNMGLTKEQIVERKKGYAFLAAIVVEQGGDPKVVYMNLLTGLFGKQKRKIKFIFELVTENNPYLENTASI